jgi:hypothetical protein
MRARLSNQDGRRQLVSTAPGRLTFDFLQKALLRLSEPSRPTLVVVSGCPADWHQAQAIGPTRPARSRTLTLEQAADWMRARRGTHWLMNLPSHATSLADHVSSCQPSRPLVPAEAGAFRQEGQHRAVHWSDLPARALRVALQARPKRSAGQLTGVERAVPWGYASAELGI